MRVGFLGPETSFTHEAALKAFPEEELVPLSSIQGIFSSLVNREISKAIVPFENSTGGIVAVTLDELIEKQVFIRHEFFLEVKHCFLGRRSISEISKVYSHPQAFEQCRGWINENCKAKELIEVSSTSKAAEMASIELHGGAIASKLAAKKFGLNILEENINDDNENTTKFITISLEHSNPSNKKKTAIVFGVKDKPGALLEVLQSFKKFDINLTKIISRPSHIKQWGYLFFTEIDGNTEEKNVAEALREVKEKAASLKVLGSYSALDKNEK